MISFFNEDVSMPNLSVDTIANWLNSVIDAENSIAGDISIIFCSDNYLLEMNNRYLKHDFFTDVITFDYTENTIVSGDIFISIDRVRDNAEQFLVSFDIELLRIMVHGLLHLLGYKDKLIKDKELMTKLENIYLDKINN